MFVGGGKGERERDIWLTDFGFENLLSVEFLSNLSLMSLMEEIGQIVEFDALLTH